MVLKKIPTDPKDPIEVLYVVEEISEDDIAPPSTHFLNFLRELPSLSFVNSFTMGEFTDQVRKRFATAPR